VAGNYALDALASPGYRGTIHDVWLIGTSILGEIGTASIIYGLVTVAGAALAGPTRVAVALRRRIAPALDRHLGLSALGLSATYLLLILWGPTHALRTWWGVLLFAVLIAAGVAALRRQTRSELAAREEPSLATSLLERLPQPRQASRPGSPADEIARLADLRDEGVISEDEFALAKKLALS
jgi:hypothetical protein